MSQEEHQEVEKELDSQPNKYMQIKKFHFVMIMFLLVFLTAGITTFALSFGDEKVVEKIQVRDRVEFAKLYETFERIKSNYIDQIDEETLIEGAVNGMVEAIEDPYSDYMTVEESKLFQENITSSFEGIGAHIEEKDGYIVIVAPIKGSPAEKAGLKANDMIIEVDGKSIQGMSAQEAVTLIRGEKGTVVELTIMRPGIDDPIKVKITRDVIPIETVYSEMLDDHIGKIQITSFSEHTFDELEEHLTHLEKHGMKGLILDLRQNPGGLLDQAIKIASEFVPKGEVLYQMEYKDGSRDKQLSNKENPFEYPLAVVVDGGSASASEIVAAALKESAGVPVVGEKTYGKGTAQTNVPFTDGSSLKLTTAKWLTPKGNWIHEKGLEPNYLVPMPDYANLPYIDPELQLKENTVSEHVTTIETMLDVLGYDPGTIDGLYDKDTKQAVIEFQKAFDLDETGVVTGETTVKIMEQLRNKLIEEDPQIQKAMELVNEQIEKTK
ncbi:S41 family peptidase [Fervidibacillus halotolerans]|uniref:S41 family peptidase n=1 Tax=Fervidibacillus halotolerans TaxID=2980027 RepID=A0A9E8RXZ9_9BACI|nr:S41 family peptidase [Fervidibacillus halotolerans]WAA13290.1 S41 family peptidase [Fervidibacillus halotolerans]